MESEGLIADTTRRILGDLADPQTVNKAGDGWKAPAWAALEDAGLTLAWVPEALGGAGAETADGFAVLRQAGRFAAAVPLGRDAARGLAAVAGRHCIAQGRHDLRTGARGRSADARRPTAA